MGMTCRYVLLVTWLALMLLSALLLFSRGFLLTRNVLNHSSCCSDDFVRFENVRNIHDLFEPPSNCSQVFCLGSSDVRAIVVIVDALRYDFVSPYKGTKPLPYHNQLTVFNELVASDQAKLYKFIADPPTTTFQRIIALTTGSLPTFIDVGSNFASSEINEDNLVDKLRGKNKTVVFMGDDTWIGLYPNRFTRQYPFPSFNVWDLDTVDRGVKSHLVPEMRHTDWDVIFAHVLGVDHCGHRYGAQHSEMSRKLMETNNLLKEVVDNMDDRTVLFVMGDHGMTESGDHGGETTKEVQAALIVYTKNPLISSRLSSKPSVHQVDFVPTFSQIMGLPIPFSSLGSSFLTHVPQPDSPQSTDLAALIVWTNVQQVTSYIREYASKHTQFPSSVVSRLLNNYTNLQDTYKNLNLSNFPTFMSESLKYIEEIRELCRAVWVQFDSFAISRGLVLIFLAIALGFIVVDGLPSELLGNMIKGPFLWYGFLAMVSSGGLCCLLRYFQITSHLELTLYIASCCSSIVALSCPIGFNWFSVAEHWYELNKSADLLSVLTRVIALVSALGMFSNSYIVHEASTIPYLLTSLIWVSVIDTKLDVMKKLTDKCSNFSIIGVFLSSVKCKLILLVLSLNIILRLSFYFWECREEQNTNCHRVKNMSKTISCVMAVVSYATYITLARLLLRNFGNLTGWTPPIFVSRYFPTANVVCCGCYWILNSLPAMTRPKLFFSWQVQLLPITVFFISGGAIVLLYYSPLCVHCTHNSVIYRHGNVIPSIFHKIRNIMSTGGMYDQEDRTPVVYGLATVYSATFINVAIFISFLSAILLGESRAVVNVLMICCLFLLATILSLVKFDRAKNHKGNHFSVPWWSIICWSLSSSHFFYATGHQPTFSTIQWDCAGLFGNIVSTFVPGLLVLANTFISQIVHSLLLPLLLIIPFTVATVWPKVVPSGHEFHNGELELFQNSELRRQEMFNLLARYILFSAFKVFVSMFSASIHSRHLMIWAIFAPKFIFEGVSFIVSLPFLLLGFLFVERISAKIGALVSGTIHLD